MTEPKLSPIGIYASIKHGTDHGHHYHTGLAIEPKLGPVLRMDFVPKLAVGEDPVMPMTAASLRELAAGALRMAEALDAIEAARDGRG